MNVRKFLVTLCVLLMAIFMLVGCGASSLQVNQLMTDRYALTTSQEDLQPVSDLIVVFTPEEQENILQYYNDGLVAFGYTKTTGIVLQVLKGDVAVGDEICITEECYTTDSDTILWTQGGYLPMKPEGEYLLFLKAYDADDPDYAGMYFPVDLEYGKYTLDNGGATSWMVSREDRFEVAETGDLDKYVQWREYVFDLYPELNSG